MKQIKEIFDNHPTEKEVHATSDGIMFFQKHHAEAHSKTLENKEVVTHSRESLGKVEMESSEVEKTETIPMDTENSIEESSKSKTKKTK